MKAMEIGDYPEWFKSEKERRGLDEIREFLRNGEYPVFALVVEEEAYFIQAMVGKVTDELRDAACAFNDGSHPIMFDFVPPERIEDGQVFHV